MAKCWHENLVKKSKIFGQDFVTIKTGIKVRFVLFLVDKLRRKHLFKHANENKNREDSCIVQVTCKTVAFRFFQTHSEVRVP